MKISRVTTHVVSTSWRELVIVRVETDEGIVGYGEVRILNKVAPLLAWLGEVVPRDVVGRDPFDREGLAERLVTGAFNMPDEISVSGASILEIACWDIMGKKLGVPVYRLLGGAIRHRIPLYANGWYRVDRTPDAFARAAESACRKGYQALKFDPFGPARNGVSRTDARLAQRISEAVRAAVGPEVQLMIEMHGRFSAAGAIEMAERLQPLSPAWFEEPVPPHNAGVMAKAAAGIRSRGIPVAAGERIHHRPGFRELLETQSVDILQPDITQCGGIEEFRRAAAWADVYGIQTAPHNVGGPISTAAALHAAASTGNFLILENFNDFDVGAQLDFAKGLPGLGSDGCTGLPLGPGLGLEIDDQALTGATRRPVFFDLYRPDWHKRTGETG